MGFDIDTPVYIPRLDTLPCFLKTYFICTYLCIPPARISIWGFQLMKKKGKSGVPLLGTGGAESGGGWVASMCFVS